MMKSWNWSLLCFSWTIIILIGKSNVLVQGQSITCDDGTECQNGSTCIPLESGFKAPNSKSPNGKRAYRCDCTKIERATKYAGYECEYPAVDYCLFGTNVQDASVSFCVNDGECTETTAPSDNGVAE